jgi:hypothetical protein
MNPEKKIINTAVASSILGSALAGCVPPQNNPSVEELTPEEQTIREEDLVLEGEFEIEEKEQITPQYDYGFREEKQANVAKEVTIEEVEEYLEEEIKEEFDYSVLDIHKWNEFELDSVEQKDPGYVVTVSNPTSFFVLPLSSDEFLEEDREVEEIVLNEGMPLEISEVRRLTGPEGEEITIGLVANTFGAKAASAVVVDGKDVLGTRISFVEEREGNSSAVAYVNLSESIYPNKVYNTYRALLNISQFQDEYGPLKTGEENSYLEMIGLLNSNRKSQYLRGLMSSGTEARAGGVCAMATGMSLLVHQDENNKIIEQWHHPSRYYQGPFSLSPYVVDATVQLVDGEDDYDFRWEFANDTYLQINVDMSLSDVPYSETASNGIGGLSDVNTIFSISLADEYPEGQSERLEKQMREYLEFRNSKHLSAFENYEHSKYPTEEIREAVDLIFNREDISLFEQEIEESEVLQDILAFQEAVNSYEEDSEVWLAHYLKTTEWYKNYIKNPKRSQEAADHALRIMSHVRIPGQPLQCVSYAAILPILYPELEIQGIGGSSVSSASELIAKQHTSLNGSAGTGFGGLLVANRNLTIDDYMQGDLFVTKAGRFGHVGVIVAVKEITKENGESKKVLLVTDANRMVDGKIKTFTVDEHSLEFIFGPHHRYLIRSAANHTVFTSQEELKEGN